MLVEISPNKCLSGNGSQYSESAQASGSIFTPVTKKSSNITTMIRTETFTTTSEYEDAWKKAGQSILFSIAAIAVLVTVMCVVAHFCFQHAPPHQREEINACYTPTLLDTVDEHHRPHSNHLGKKPHEVDFFTGPNQRFAHLLKRSPRAYWPSTPFYQRFAQPIS